MHFVFRDWANQNSPIVNTGGGIGRLTEDDSWSHPYDLPGSWRERQRKTFAGT